MLAYQRVSQRWIIPLKKELEDGISAVSLKPRTQDDQMAISSPVLLRLPKKKSHVEIRNKPLKNDEVSFIPLVKKSRSPLFHSDNWGYPPFSDKNHIQLTIYIPFISNIPLSLSLMAKSHESPPSRCFHGPRNRSNQSSPGSHD